MPCYSATCYSLQKKRLRKEKKELNELLESMVEPAEDDDEDGNIPTTFAYGIALATLSNKRCGSREKPINRVQQNLVVRLLGRHME